MDNHDLLLLATARRHAATGHGYAIRIRAGVSLREMADAIGLSHAALWRWERGERVPRRGPAASTWARLIAELERQPAGGR